MVTYRQLIKIYAKLLVLNLHSILLRIAKKQSYSDPVMLMEKLRLRVERRYWDEWEKDRELLLPDLESLALCHTTSRPIFLKYRAPDRILGPFRENESVNGWFITAIMPIFKMPKEREQTILGTTWQNEGSIYILILWFFHKKGEDMRKNDSGNM